MSIGRSCEQHVVVIADNFEVWTGGEGDYARDCSVLLLLRGYWFRRGAFEPGLKCLFGNACFLRHGCLPKRPPRLSTAYLLYMETAG